MPINLNALSSAHRVPSAKQRAAQATFRKWQAVFYTLRHLIWQTTKSNVLRDAIADGTLEPCEPKKRKKDGTWTLPKYDDEQIKQLYSEAWERYNEEFDLAFAGATLEELLQYAEEHFELSLEQLLEMNRERSAERFNR